MKWLDVATSVVFFIFVVAFFALIFVVSFSGEM